MGTCAIRGGLQVWREEQRALLVPAQHTRCTDTSWQQMPQVHHLGYLEPHTRTHHTHSQHTVCTLCALTSTCKVEGHSRHQRGTLQQYTGGKETPPNTKRKHHHTRFEGPSSGCCWAANHHTTALVGG
jgi:hypothetical protein